jgi:hypothetical protein
MMVPQAWLLPHPASSVREVSLGEPLSPDREKRLWVVEDDLIHPLFGGDIKHDACIIMTLRILCFALFEKPFTLV